MNLNLEGKVFIVTGGSEGIGQAISETLMEEGAIPVIATKSIPPTELLIEANSDKISAANAIYGDLQSVSVCEKVIKETVDRFGKIDGIVNNAGVNDGKGLNAGPEAFRASLNRNLFHYYDLVHFALPYLKETKGSIVNISSKVAVTGQGNTSGYAASKGAILALTREWALDLLPFSIRVNAILPAEVLTPLFKKWLNSFENPVEKEANVVSKIPLEKRMTTPKEIASMVVFLLSDRSSHTTGQLLHVDGGYTHLDRSIT